MILVNWFFNRKVRNGCRKVRKCCCLLNGLLDYWIVRQFVKFKTNESKKSKNLAIYFLAPIASPVRFARVQRKSFCGAKQNKRLQYIAGLAPKIQTIKGLRFMKCFKLNILNILMF